MFDFGGAIDSVSNFFGGGASAAAPAVAAPAYAPVATEPLGGLAPEVAPPPAAGKDAQPVDPEKVKEKSKALWEGMDGLIQDEKKVLATLSTLSPAEREAVRAKYKEAHDGHDLDDDVTKAMDSPAQKAEAEALLKGDKVGAAMASLKGATQDGFFGTGLTTDHQKIHDTLQNLSPAEMDELKTQMGPEELKKLIGDNESGNDKALSVALVDGNKDAATAIKMDEAMHGGLLTKLADGVAETFDIDKSTMRDVVNTATTVASTVAMAIPGGQIVGIAGMMAARDKGDAGAAEKVLEGITDPEERKRVAEQYKQHTGEEMHTALSKVYEGNEVIAELEKGDNVGAEAAKLRAAGDHLTGTNKDELFKVFEMTPEQKAELKSLPPEQAAAREKELAGHRQAVIDRFNADAEKNGGKTFNDTMKTQLGEDSIAYEKLNELAKDGKNSDVVAMDYALHESSVGGVFSDKDKLKSVLTGKSKEEIAELDLQYSKRHGKDSGLLDGAIKDAASGRDGFELGQAMKGKPTTPEETMERARERYEFERSGGDSLLGYGAMAVLGGPLAVGAMALGLKPSDISRFVTDSVSDSGKVLDSNQKKLEEAYAQYQAGNPAAKALVDKWAENQQMNTEEYGVAKDKVADQAAMAGGLAVSAAAAIATGGAATPLLAALAAGAGGATTIGIKAIMKGNAYSNKELGTDTAMMAVNAATAGTLAAISQPGAMAGKGMLQAMLAGEASAGIGGLQRGALQGALAGMASGATGAALDEHNWRGNGLDLLAGIAKGGGLGALGGAAQGAANAGVLHALGENPALLGKIGELAKDNPALWGTIKGALGGAAGGAAMTIANPEAFKDPEAFVKAMGESVLQNTVAGAAQGYGEVLGGHGAPPKQEEQTPPALSPHEEAPPATLRSPTGPEPTPQPAPSVEVVPAGPAPKPDLPKEQWAWGGAVPESPGFMPEPEYGPRGTQRSPVAASEPTTTPVAPRAAEPPASAPSSLPPTEAAPTMRTPESPAASNAPAAPAEPVAVVAPNGPSTERSPVLENNGPGTKRSPGAPGPGAAEVPGASIPVVEAAPMSEPATVPKPAAEEPWAWWPFQKENPGLIESSPGSAKTQVADTEPARTRVADTEPAPTRVADTEPAPTRVADTEPAPTRRSPAEATPAAEPAPAVEPAAPSSPELEPNGPATKRSPGVTAPNPNEAAPGTSVPVVEPAPMSEPATLPKPAPEEPWAWWPFQKENPGLIESSPGSAKTQVADTEPAPTRVADTEPAPTRKASAPEPEVVGHNFDERAPTSEEMAGLRKLWEENAAPSKPQAEAAPVSEPAAPASKPVERPFEDSVTNRLEGEQEHLAAENRAAEETRAARKTAAGQPHVEEAPAQNRSAASGEEAASAARKLYDMEKALGKETITHWDGEVEVTYKAAATELNTVEQAMREFSTGSTSAQDGKCSFSCESWQGKMAEQGVNVPINDYAGHRWMSAGEVIIDPTFGQFFGGPMTELPNGKSQYEPFVGTYDEMKVRVQQAIDAGHMPDVKPGTNAAEVIQENWGIKPSSSGGTVDKVKDVRPYKAGELPPGSSPA